MLQNYSRVKKIIFKQVCSEFPTFPDFLTKNHKFPTFSRFLAGFGKFPTFSRLSRFPDLSGHPAQKSYYHIGSFSHDNFAIRFAEPEFGFHFLFSCSKKHHSILTMIFKKNSIAMLNARVCARLRALHVDQFFFEEIKNDSKSKRYSRDDSGIIQIQRSFNLQIVSFFFCDFEKTFGPIFFTSYNEFCSRQRRAKRSRDGRALDGAPTVANRNGLALAEDCTRSKVFCFLVFQLFL